jgi:Uma2 family endonuclease
MLLFDLPEVEIIDGVSVPKASPGRRHALLQGALGARLGTWGHERGEVGIEWRFRLAETPRRTELVPDVAYVAFARMAPLSDEAAEEPPFAPDIAIEVRSPGDEHNLQAKIGLYLAGGATLVLDVDPDERRIVAHAADGARTFGPGTTFAHDAAPGLTIDVDALFAKLDRHRQSR